MTRIRAGTKLQAKIAALVFMTFSILTFANISFAAPIVDLKVLVIATGTPEQDLGLDLIDNMLDEIGVPYDVLDASTTELTQERLVTGEQGNYNGIILTNSMLYYTGAGNYQNSAFTLQEWQRLHAYERDYQVRESVISGFPASGAYYKINYDLDYGMDLSTVEYGYSFTGEWQSTVDNKQIFAYVNRSNPLVISDYSVVAHPSSDASAPMVTALLTDATSGKALVSKIVYADGREVLLSTISNAWYLLYSQILNYEFLNFASNGVFIGSRKVYLMAHIDDLFVAGELWDSNNNSNYATRTYRNTRSDIRNLVTANRSFIANTPNLNDFKLDMAFNGEGAAPTGDPLTRIVVKLKNNFRFLNHTYSHRDLYASSGATYPVVYDEISKNLDIWQQLGLPDYPSARQTLVTGNHSGLEDALGSDPFVLIADYPAGLNQALVDAASDLDIRFMASDVSRPNQDVTAYIPNTDILLLPRYPTSLFYNARSPAQLTDEYNYIFHERYLENAQDPCVIAGAICQPLSYQDILAAEADTTLRQMLTYRAYPHFFHTNNLYKYTRQGKTLIYDWLYAVTQRYNHLLNLPIINMDYYQVGVLSQEKVAAKAANIRGFWDKQANLITLTADSEVSVSITGGEGGEDYAGQKILQTRVGPDYPQILNVDRGGE